MNARPEGHKTVVVIPSSIERVDSCKNLYTDDSLFASKESHAKKEKIRREELYKMIGALSADGIENKSRSLKMNVVVESARGGRGIDVAALVDSGATSTFVSREFASTYRTASCFNWREP